MLGVDGCSKGWIGIAIVDTAPESTVTAHFGATISDLLATVEDEVGIPHVVGIDIPIGLPDATVRQADRLAKTMIGPLHMSVFITPTRRALEQQDYAEGQVLNRQLTGGGFSKQVWGLRNKILQVDGWLRTSAGRVLEVHPEVCFATMAGAPLTTRKSSYSGYQQRQQLLRANGIELPADIGAAGTMAGVDDVVDAAAVAWTVRRYPRGAAQCIPEQPEQFSDGIACAIWY